VIGSLKTGYANVNGLRMYYEIHGEGKPVVLLHGALSAIGTSFGRVIPELAEKRQVIALEMQAHGRTADVNRPFSMDGMADDTVAALRQLGVSEADFFGYSLGAGVALNIAIRHPQVVRMLILASVTYNLNGFHAGLLEGITDLKPEDLAGSQWQKEYAELAPHPEAFAALIEKVRGLNASIADWPAEAIRSIAAPTLLVFGDSDIIRLDHALEMFGLLGGGINGDTPSGLPKSRLAVLPGTSHTMVVERAELLLPIVNSFLE
jgi:pimeloyl-ACP methyl ester carboxylesterase